MPYTGTARVVIDADDALDRVDPGDVIVARLTVPTFNSVLAIAGAVVTENGGLLCHTAVIARELGIPAVVGVADALTGDPGRRDGHGRPRRRHGHRPPVNRVRTSGVPHRPGCEAVTCVGRADSD